MEKKRILIAVDDAAVAEGKYTCFPEYNVQNVSLEYLFEAAERFAPHIILLDADSRNTGGLEILSRLSENEGTLHIPVIYITAQKEPAAHECVLRVGAADIVIKPFFPALLRMTVRRHILVSEQNAQLRRYERHIVEILAERKADALLFQDVFLSTIIAIADNKTLQIDSIGSIREYIASMTAEMNRKNIYNGELDEVYDDEFAASAQLHDMGKIIVQDSILQKPGRLTSEEFEAVKRHTKFGVKVIEQIEKNIDYKTFFRHAKLFASTHHERWDGKGYPQKISGEAIPLHGRLMAIVDTYDALMSNRPYKQAITHEETREIISAGAGTHFDPKLVKVFLSVADEFAEIKQKRKF